MKLSAKYLVLSFLAIVVSCQEYDLTEENSTAEDLQNPSNQVGFEHRSTISVGGEGASEISAFDAKSKKLFVVNVENNEISVFDLSDVDNPATGTPIGISAGAPNSVSVHKGKLAIAVEATTKQDPGRVLVYDAQTQNMIASYTVGALPDMVTFSPNGQYLVTANEGEPDDDYSIDPLGSVSIITTATGEVNTLTFEAYNGQEQMLREQGIRIFGPGATAAQDLEPEYVAISDNSNTAWVTLQENNAIARIDLNSKQVEGLFPLGYKDYNLSTNSIDASNEDGEKVLKTWPIVGMYQPDAIAYAKIRGTDYLFTANEGDARDYDGYSEEERVKDVLLDPIVYPASEQYQLEENLGRLNITTANGDTDGDGDIDLIHSYGARSFSVWSGNVDLLYDSGNEIGSRTLALTPDRFNDDDSRSDDKGAEPEAVSILELPGKRFILFVGLERNDQILVYDVSNPLSPQFLQLLSNEGDEAPEGLLVVPAKDSPTGNDLLIVANEDSGTVSIYENM